MKTQACLLALLALAAAPAPAPEACELEAADGRVFQGTVSFLESGAVRIGAGATPVAWARVYELRRPGARAGLPPPTAAVVETASGDRLVGPLEGDAKGLRIRVAEGGTVPLAPPAVRWIRFHRRDRTPAMDIAMEKALADPGLRDLLLAVDEKGETVTIPGAIESFGKTSLKFRREEKVREVFYDRLAAAVLARPAETKALPALACRAFLRNGSILTGAWRGSEKGPALDVAGAGTVPLGPDEWIRILSLKGAFDSLSDRMPARVSEASALGEDLPRLSRNRAIAGGPISIRGRVHDKGLGLRPKVSAEWNLGGHASRLVGWAGLDDSAGPGSRAVLSIEADGKRLFGPQTLSAADDSVRIDCDLSGAKALRIECDFAEGSLFRSRVAIGSARLLPRE